MGHQKELYLTFNECTITEICSTGDRDGSLGKAAIFWIFLFTLDVS